MFYRGPAGSSGTSAPSPLCALRPQGSGTGLAEDHAGANPGAEVGETDRSSEVVPPALVWLTLDGKKTHTRLSTRPGTISVSLTPALRGGRAPRLTLHVSAPGGSTGAPAEARPQGPAEVRPRRRYAAVGAGRGPRTSGRPGEDLGAALGPVPRLSAYSAGGPHKDS